MLHGLGANVIVLLTILFTDGVRRAESDLYTILAGTKKDAHHTRRGRVPPSPRHHPRNRSIRTAIPRLT
jgi:hypothetical protein